MTHLEWTRTLPAEYLAKLMLCPNERLRKLWREVGDVSDSIAQGYIKLPDIIDTLRQEYGIDLRV